MPARSAVSILAAPAPTSRQCLLFLYPCSLLCKPASFSAVNHADNTPNRRCHGHKLRPQLRVIEPRHFHTTSPNRDEAIDNARNHYETLKVAPGATAAEIKKSFYTLSKTHHPDVHAPSSRSSASKRFMRISEAYAILSHPSKRQKYDREHLPASQRPPPHSYSSTNPAGGRPASGLSRRRGTFTGPPPSFFRNGTYGNYGGKRREAHDESTGGAESRSQDSNPSAEQNTHSGSMGGTGGMNPGQSPFHNHNAEVPHFDRDSHERTGHNLHRRRAAAAAQSSASSSVYEEVSVESERGIGGMFLVISGVILFAALGPFFFLRLSSGPGSGSGREISWKGVEQA